MLATSLGERITTFRRILSQFCSATCQNNHAPVKVRTCHSCLLRVSETPSLGTAAISSRRNEPSHTQNRDTKLISVPYISRRQSTIFCHQRLQRSGPYTCLAGRTNRQAFLSNAATQRNVRKTRRV